LYFRTNLPDILYQVQQFTSRYLKRQYKDYTSDVAVGILNCDYINYKTGWACIKYWIIESCSNATGMTKKALNRNFNSKTMIMMTIITIAT